MPIALDPNQTFTVSLKLDSPDEGKRATFTFRYLTGRQWIALSGLTDSVEDRKKTAADLLTELGGSLSASLVGWAGIPATFNRDGLLDHLTPPELYELAGLVLNRSVASEIDLKKSAAPSPSATASSALTAAA